MENARQYKVIEVFADDLYRYLFPRRIHVFDTSDRLERPDDIPVVFHPHIGMSVLCESQRKQPRYFAEFARWYPDFTDDLQSFMVFCTDYAVKLREETPDDAFKTLIAVSSMILEACTFCHIRGHKHFKYYAHIVCGEVLIFFLKEGYFQNYDWTLMQQLAADDAKMYMDAKYEICLDDKRVEHRNEWLRSYDLWAAVYPYAIMPYNEETYVVDNNSPVTEPYAETSIDTSDTVPQNQGIADEKETIPPDSTSSQIPKQMSTDPVKFQSDSIPVAQKINTEPLVKFKLLIANNRDPACQRLSKMLESEDETNILMNSDIFLQVVNETVENNEKKIKNEHILELAKLILLDNEYLASVFVQVAQYIEVTVKVGNYITNVSELSTQPSSSSVATPLQETDAEAALPSGTKSALELGAIPKRQKKCVNRDNIPPHEAYSKLIKDFKRAISAGFDVVGLEICEILDTTANVNLLLNDPVFRSVMELTVKHPVKRWGNGWLLSFVKTIILASEKASMDEHSSQISETDLTKSSKKRKNSSKQQEELESTSTESKAPDLTPSANVLNITEVAEIAPVTLSDNSQEHPNVDSSGTINAELQIPKSISPDQSHFLRSFSDLQIIDPADDPGESEETETVYLDIISLNLAFKHLMDNVLAEKGMSEHSESKPQISLTDDKTTQADQKLVDQSKPKTRKRSKKNRHRKQGQGNQSSSNVSSVSEVPEIKETPEQSIKEIPEEIETVGACLPVGKKCLSEFSQSDIINISQKITELTIAEDKKLQTVNKELERLCNIGNSLIEAHKLNEMYLGTPVHDLIADKVESFISETNTVMQSLNIDLVKKNESLAIRSKESSQTVIITRFPLLLSSELVDSTSNVENVIDESQKSGKSNEEQVAKPKKRRRKRSTVGKSLAMYGKVVNESMDKAASSITQIKEIDESANVVGKTQISETPLKETGDSETCVKLTDEVDKNLPNIQNSYLKSLLKCVTENYSSIPTSTSSPVSQYEYDTDKEITSSSQQIRDQKVSEQHSTSRSQNASPETVDAFQRMLEFMPIGFSAEVSDWIFQRIRENAPEFLRTLKDKEDIDESIMIEIMKYRDQFYEMNKETQSSSDNPETHDQGSNLPEE